MDFNSSALWGIIGLVGGAIISGLFYKIGLKRRQLSIDIETYPIISQKVSQVKGLEIKYNSKEIDTLYFSTIMMKNVGNTIIEKSDFAPSHPLSINTSGIFLADKDSGLQLETQNGANNVSTVIEMDDAKQCKKILVSYDYISKKEELTCTLFHTGDISYDGVLKDGKIIDAEKIRKRKKIVRLLLDFLCGILGVLIAFVSNIVSVV